MNGESTNSYALEKVPIFSARLLRIFDVEGEFHPTKIHTRFITSHIMKILANRK